MPSQVTMNYVNYVARDRAQLLPWAVITSPGQFDADERMMWAQMGLNRMQVALGDFMLWLLRSDVAPVFSGKALGVDQPS